MGNKKSVFGLSCDLAAKKVVALMHDSKPSPSDSFEGLFVHNFVSYVSSIQRAVAEHAASQFPELVNLEDQKTWPFYFKIEDHENYDACVMSLRDPVLHEPRKHIFPISHIIKRGFDNWSERFVEYLRLWQDFDSCALF